MRMLEAIAGPSRRLVLPFTIVLAACGDRTTSDTATRDVTLAQRDSVVPQLADAPRAADSVPSTAPVAAPPVSPPEPVAAAPAPAPVARTTTPRPAPAARRTPAASPSAAAEPTPVAQAPARPASGTIAAGTTFRVTSGAKVCSNTLQPGERISATLAAPVSGTNDIAVPAGARVGLVVVESRSAGGSSGTPTLTFDVRSISTGGETYTVQGSVSTEAVVTERAGGDGRKVAIGAAAGAIIGNVIGGGSRAQRTVVGAAAGGLAGAATAAVTGDRYACLPEGSTLTVRLGAPLTVRP